MGWDLKAATDGVATNLPALPQMPSLTTDVTLPQAAHWVMLALIGLAIVSVITRLVPRLWSAIEETLFTSWQLAVLGAAAFLLSLAGAWTTWDGMRNFTGEPVLSAMFTFGIHGLMLIVAWLIGETFATGMNQVRLPSGRSVSPPMVALTVVGGSIVLVGLIVAMLHAGLSSDQLLYASLGVGALLLAIALVMTFSKSDVVQPYTQGLRIIAKNAMLWVMFLACMATSVFFSFDSRFNVIFPKDQRERAAEIRTKNQVASVVTDIGDTISTRRLAEAERLFQSEGWKDYEGHLDALSKASEGAEADIERHFTQQIEAHRSGIAQQQERIATATSSQAGLASKKAILTDELSRLKSERPTLAAEMAGKKTELDNRAKEVDAKRVEAMAEEKGAEGTLKEGRGPVYRAIMADMARLKEYYKIGEERVRDAQKRLDTSDTRIATLERELAGVDGELAKLKGEAETAEQRIKMAETSPIGQEGPKTDPARVRAAFERARVEYRQEPAVEKLSALQQHCVQLYDAMISTEATKARVKGVDCDPKRAIEAAAVIFALNAGQAAFAANCAGGDKVPAAGVDRLLDFGRKCLQDSGLATREQGDMAAKLSYIDLNRDDKAHSFVVSLNAFQDGNRLAYLALAIAIGIDSLIFMAGLFGANALRSPLADVPSSKARNSQQLNDMIEAALLPDVFKKARLVAQAMHPIAAVDGFTNEVRLQDLDPETAVQVREVLNAGAIIGAVRQGRGTGHYYVRSELLEFINSVIKRQLEINPEGAQRGMMLDQLDDQIRVALLPSVAANCDLVLRQLDAIDELNGFTSEVYVDRVPEQFRPPLLNVLNTGSTFQVVQRDKADADRYYLHKDLYKALSRLRAREYARGFVLDDAAPGYRLGGRASEYHPAISDQSRAALSPVAAPQVANENAKDRYVNTMLIALGLDPAVVNSISGPSFAAAAQASEAFQHVRRSNRALDDEFAARDEEVHRAVEAAYNREASQITPSEQWKRGELDMAYTEIEQTWQVLMLMPNGPYENVVRRIIEQMEPDSGAGRLSADDRALFEAARGLSNAMAPNARGSDKDWMQLEGAFHQAVRAQAPKVAANVKRVH